MFSYFRVLAAIPGFFISSLILWALWGVVAPKIGLEDSISYATAMLVTITAWLTVAPLAAVGGKRRK
jgi:positive regulator of sigma E activity